MQNGKVEYEKHFTILAILHICWGLMGLVGAAFLLLALVGPGLIGTVESGEALPLMILGAIGTILAGFVFITHIPAVIGGIGLLKRKSWSRILLLIVGIFNLLAIPIGTALGIYTIWVLWNQESAELLE